LRPTATLWPRRTYLLQKVRHGLTIRWSESQLREYLLEQGVVSPKSTREQLLVLAKNQYVSSYLDVIHS
jgi:hypothetical protein